MAHDLRTHALPQDGVELEKCAVRMGYAEKDRLEACKRFAADHARHIQTVHDQFVSFFSRPEKSPLFRAALRHKG